MKKRRTVWVAIGPDHDDVMVISAKTFAQAKKKFFRGYDKEEIEERENDISFEKYFVF